MLPLLPPSPSLVIVLGGCDRGGGCGILGRGFDEIGGKGHVEGMVHDYLKNFVKANKTVVDHLAVVFFCILRANVEFGFPWHTNLGGEVAVGGDAPLENDLLGQNCGVK